jgi:PAS domain S-box-containing protein
MRDETDDVAGTGEDVVITSELGKRPSRSPDHEAEARALLALVHELAVRPHELLQTIADIVREVCGADSSAVSILEPAVSGGVWRWHAASGAFAPSVTAMMRCGAGPGPDVLRRNQVLLLRGAERVFDGLRGEPQLAETLLASCDAEGQRVGMLWAISHDPGRHFDAEDARLLSVLARFAAAAWQVAQTQSAALAESEERYQNLFNSLDEGFVVAELLFDPEDKPFDLIVLETNPSFDRMMRTTNAAGKRALEIFPDAEPSWFEAYAHVVRTGKSLRFENYLRPLDSWFDLYISRIGGVGSRRFAIVFNDITLRKRTESELRQSEERLRLVVESASDYAIFTTDVEGRIVSWNVGAERLFGWTEHEALGTHMRIVFTPEDVAGGVAEMDMRQAQETGRAADERWQLTKDGGRFFSSGILVALRADGILSGFAKIARDLTERKQLEDAQRDAHEQLEHRVRARTS